ncbi:phosphonate transport system ATP-binding protein [Carboxydocella sporoproducens DSM 16521]|uniref:Phosphonate transport system ATP-binding protein n=2 Tax=Carboxydocella TaxID=178898 RepID=A0A1T4Q0S7_9FIRM|nr:MULTISPECIES: phosphonate ABC transporter ATP-binding protein [Carboxydocella]AVX21228.1 phosphonate transport system ATP-binding protein [Carboxydocella thermautotrophica]AVX31660.1 phosphonate transport system ATP-binding protein [Carboxydocella thermautotrophica]SJZ97382.1 phosphonate transport system ATP-binding protein [Carboxydocella sporoproducens DSM 16521]
MKPIIQVENVSKVYGNGTKALKEVSFSIKAGERVGILGASGSGKTTLFRLLNGSLLPTSGRVSVLGQDLAELSHRQLRQLRTRISLVYQNYNLIPGLSVAHNVYMGRLGSISPWQVMRSLGWLTVREREEIQAVLASVGLANKLEVKASELSGGQQQRVAIARTILARPEIILADEPIASVDVHTAHLLLNIFKELNEKQGITLVCNLHQVDFALTYCQRLLVLQKGQLIYDGPPEAFPGPGRWADA